MTDRQAGQPADRQGHADFAGGDAEIEIILAAGEQVDQRAADRQQRGHHVAVEPAGMGQKLPHRQHAQDDGDAQQRHRTERRRRYRRLSQSTGLSHRSAFSNAMKNNTLTRITKQIAA